MPESFGGDLIGVNCDPRIWSITYNSRLRAYIGADNLAFVPRRPDMQCLSRQISLRDHVLAAEPGQTLFWEGDPCTHVIEVRSGIVRGVSISEEGERQVTAFFRHAQGQWCAAMADSLQVSGRLLHSIGAEQDPVFRRGMLIGRSGALSRMAAFLSAIMDRLEPCGTALRFPLPQIDIAAYLALTPETVCRSLKQLREMGVIDMPSHGRLIVLDRARLELSAHSSLHR
jgi:CRP-like cAMP-binding protein